MANCKSCDDFISVASEYGTIDKEIYCPDCHAELVYGVYVDPNEESKIPVSRCPKCGRPYEYEGKTEQPCYACSVDV